MLVPSFSSSVVSSLSVLSLRRCLRKEPNRQTHQSTHRETTYTECSLNALTVSMLVSNISSSVVSSLIALCSRRCLLRKVKDQAKTDPAVYPPRVCTERKLHALTVSMLVSSFSSSVVSSLSVLSLPCCLAKEEAQAECTARIQFSRSIWDDACNNRKLHWDQWQFSSCEGGQTDRQTDRY